MVSESKYSFIRLGSHANKVIYTKARETPAVCLLTLRAVPRLSLESCDTIPAAARITTPIVLIHREKY